MNLILFEPHELDAPLPRVDRRAAHIIEVLRRRVGDEFDAGVVNGPRGKATLTGIGEKELALSFHWNAGVSPAGMITLLVGLPRPQTARDLLREMTTLGVSQLHFVATEKSEPSYASSTLWSSGEWKRHAVAGAEQAFDTRVPEISWDRRLPPALAALAPGGIRVALDHYEGATALGQVSFPAEAPVTLAIGPERGWSSVDRLALREQGFVLVHIGPRVLRVESAAIAALAIIRARRGEM